MNVGFVSDKKSLVRITLLQLYMYFVGPCIWGLWMVGRLKLITQKEFLYCLLSPIVIFIFIVYFVVNNAYLRLTISRLKGSASKYPASNKEISSLDVLKLHCASVVTFGTLGTTVFLLVLLSFNDVTLKATQVNLVQKVIIGALSGTSLVFGFYTFFSVTIFANLIHIFQYEKPEVTDKTYEKLSSFNSFVYSIGLYLLISTSIAAYMTRFREQAVSMDYMDIILSIVSLLFTIIMSFLLYRKSIKRLHSIRFKLCSEQEVVSQSQGKQTKQMFRRVVRLLSLSLFIVLILEDKTKLWLILLMIGFLSSLFMGRIYCSFVCPVNTVNSFEKVLYNLCGITKLRVPGFFKYSFLRYAWVVLLGTLSAVVYVSNGKVSVFMLITLTGILVSTFYVSALWCQYLCPWARIFKVLERIPVGKCSIDKKNCSHCKRGKIKAD